MQIAYVLVSDKNDIYYEECMISILSLKKHSPNAKITVIMDDETYDGLVGKRTEIKEYATIITVSFGEGVSKHRRSRELKISIRELVQGPFLFVDTDTVFCDEISEDAFAGIRNLGMVLDKHSMIDRYFNRQFYHSNAEKLGFSVGFGGRHFNSGVMFVDDKKETYDFFNKWKDLYSYSVKRKIYNDQVSMNEANNRFNGIISELSGEWNVQVDTGINYIHNAKIIHYAGFNPNHVHSDVRMSVPYKLCDYNLFKKYKETGKIPKEIQNIIDNPRAGFKNVYIISDDCAAYDVLGSYQFKVIRLLESRFRIIYALFEKILCFVVKPFIK